MTDPVADAARAAAATLAPDHGPHLPAQVEAALAARDTSQRPGQYTDHITEIIATEITRHTTPPR